MRESPLLFTAPMVRAILDGTKTQTRRLVKRVPLDWLESGFTPEYVALPGNDLCPHGRPGDHIWVRETHFINDYRGAGVPEDERAETELVYAATDMDYVRNLEDDEGFAWRPSIHMPRWACRIVLEVTGVRVERLQDISAEDCIAEGLRTNLREHDAVMDLRDQFRELWASTGGDWDANPWVWVVEFRRVEVR